MATVVHLRRRIDEIIEDSYKLKNEAEQAREREYAASVSTQSWFRGLRTRQYLKYLNSCAVNIQRRWRGFLGRRYFRILVKNSVFILKMNFYNLMASKIQKVWRGFYVRKYVFNYYSRMRYLEALKVKNEIIRSELQEYSEQQAVICKKLQEEQDKRQHEYEARKHHYLISTVALPGIYNSPFLQYPTEKELLLQSVKPLSHSKKQPKDKQFDPACTNYSSNFPANLSVSSMKPQGPFREPEEVQKQRYKPFQPSLRVATDFYSLEKARDVMKAEEWVSRLHDEILQPFTRRSVPYQPLLYTTSKYGHLAYGTKHFREEHLEKHIVEKPFKTVLPPIPIFSKLNDTYSKGQV